MACVFCRIISGELPAYRLLEDWKFLAILDINPNTDGMTVVMTKKHYPSNAFRMRERIYSEFLLFARKTARLLDKKLDVRRTAMVMEGMGIDHAHIKLYPLHGLKKEFEEMWHPKKVFFKKYPGYITTQLGPRADDKKLARIAMKLRNATKT